MFKAIAQLIQKFFAPSLELLAHLPPSAVIRFGSPF